MGPLGTLLEPLDQPEFADGLEAGLLVLVVVAVLGLAARLVFDRPAPVAGLGMAAAALVAMGRTVEVPSQVVLGAILCAAAGLLIDLFGVSPLLVAPAALPGALVIANAPGLPDKVLGVAGADLGHPGAVIVAIVAGGALTAAFDRRWHRHAWAPPLLAATAAGIYSTVPDTELALAVFGATIAVALAGWPLRAAHLGGAGSLAAVAVLAWSVAAGGVGRDGSIIGGLACLGMLAVDPAVRLAGGHSPLRRFRVVPATAIMTAAHVTVVLFMARVAGLRSGATAAALLVGFGFAAAALAWAAAGMLTRRGGAGRRTGRRGRSAR